MGPRSPWEETLRTLGVVDCPAFYRDRLYLAAVVAAGVFWCGLALYSKLPPARPMAIYSWPFFSLVCWQPFWEEVLFRGVIQGVLVKDAWGKRHWHGVTAGNGVTSLLFSLGHFWSHPPLWAMAVMIPALLFGYYRDRYACLYPSIVLHMYYNAGFFMLMGLP